MDDNNKPDGDEMLSIPKGRMEWNFNTIVTLGGVVVGAFVTAFGWGVIYNTMTNNDDKAVAAIAEVRAEIGGMRQSTRDRSREIDSKFYAIEQKIPEITRLDDKLTRLVEIIAAQGKAIEETNKRIDRVVESQNGKLDTIIARQSDQSADIKVIQSQLSDQQRSQRTRLPVLTPDRVR